MSDKKYIVIFLSFFSISLFTIGIFDYLVDPFEIFNTKKITDFNKIKPESDRRQRLSKAYVVEKNCPENLIMGNSRALAISSSYDAWPGKYTYNYALSSANMYETFRYFQHAIASCSIKSVILSVDFLMFEKSAGHATQFSEQRLKVTSEGIPTSWRIKAKLQDSVPAIFSLTALKASLRTLRKQKKQPPIKHMCSAPQIEHHKIKNKGGHYTFMMETNRKEVKKFTLNHDSTYHNLSLEYYSNILKIAHKKNINLILLIPPSHASLYESLRISPIKNHLNNWLENIIKVNEYVASSVNKPAYDIYNFSGYNSITTEMIPSINQLDIGMHWFWESLHFKKELSYHMLDRIFQKTRENCKTPDDFGIKINSQNFSNYIKEQNKKRENYTNTHPKMISQ